MARFYSEAHTEGGEQVDIPTPAVDMGSSQTRFGSTGSFVSGGAYVRKSVFGSRELSVSWNNLDTYDTAALLRLSEVGPFVWDNPMARANVAPPWLANHGALSEVEHDKLGFSRGAYLIEGEGISSDGTVKEVVNSFTGYPTFGGRTRGIEYMFDSVTRAPVFSFVVPEGFRASFWCVGGRSGTASLRLRLGGSTSVSNPQTPSSGSTYPVSRATTLAGRSGLATVEATGSGELWLSAMRVVVWRVGSGDEPSNTADRFYVPGLGNSELEFTEEGLTLVQHSAALDMQSAAATWKETGWWR